MDLCSLAQWWGLQGFPSTGERPERGYLSWALGALGELSGATSAEPDDKFSKSQCDWSDWSFGDPFTTHEALYARLSEILNAIWSSPREMIVSGFGAIFEGIENCAKGSHDHIIFSFGAGVGSGFGSGFSSCDALSAHLRAVGATAILDPRRS